LRLSRLAALYVFLLGFPDAVVPLGGRTPRRSSRLPASNKIEFSYLNANLMVPKFYPLTLPFDGLSHEADNVSFRRSNDGFVTT